MVMVSKLTSNEIYYLNKALDGKDIYGIDSLRAKAREGISPESAEEALIRKNFISKDKKIKESGFLFLKRLEDYKNADYYIVFNGMIAAYIDETSLVVLSCDEKGEYILDRKIKAKIAGEIFQKNPFLLGKGEAEGSKKRISYEVFSEMLEFINEEEVLCVARAQSKETSFLKVFFENEGSVFKYDYEKKTLFSINPQEARGEILDLFGIKRGE